MQVRTSSADNHRISVSNTPSCSTLNSGPDDIESLGDVYIWGKVCFDNTSTDIHTPKLLESDVVIDAQQIACGVRHFALVTKQGEILTCGEESGGRLGHGVDQNVDRPKLVEFLSVTKVDSVSCGEYHTCAVSICGDLYTWGDGSHNAGLLGHGTDVSHWIPKRVSGPLEGIQVASIACGNWHTALLTVDQKLYTFGDGTYGALGHGDRENLKFPKEVADLSGLKTFKVACGIWHTAAIVEIVNQQTRTSKKLYTWGDGDKYRLGHGDKETYTQPTCVTALTDFNFHQLACGHSMTIGLTTSGHVYTMGSPAHGQLGNPQSDGKTPCLVQDKLAGEFVEEITCGAYHVAVLTSRSEVFTWGKGANGRLGHGDLEDRNTPTLVEYFKDRVVRSLSCGANFTASICVHKWVSGVSEQTVCHGCRQQFGFTRKRHNCYNCGLVHCHGCSSRKALNASLAPIPGVAHRVCDPCYIKLKKAAETGINNNNNTINISNSINISNNVTTFNQKLSSRVPKRTSRPLITPSTEMFKIEFVKSGKDEPQSDYFSLTSQVPCFQNLKDVAFPSSLDFFQNALRPSKQLSVPVSSDSSSAGSPIFSRAMVDGLKKSNEALDKEVSKLQNQVTHLKQKCDKQDSDIQELQNVVKQSESLVAEKTASFTVVADAFKCILSQLTELTEKLPPEISNDETFTSLTNKVNDYINTYSSDTSALQSTDQAEEVNKSTEDGDVAEEKPSENKESSTSSTNTTEAEGEVIEQYEPGVYVTTLQLTDDTKVFKRVRFSKRTFNAQQAEEWWKDKKEMLFNRYRPAASSSTAQPPGQQENQDPPPAT